ncbi:MAG TPA: RNA polymerase subunit sigma-70 [Acidimicrobiales bacterium]|nr:RNA polymerase subunit sigma-70 [Acidimicrobiales bacterium]
MSRGPDASPPAPAALVEAAVGGDEAAFAQLVSPHRGELHVHAYRMLGSLHDADDALQDALLRAWRGLRTFETGRSLRPWLYRITTNVCLDMLGRRRARVLPFDHSLPSDPEADPGEPLPASTWIEPYPDSGAAVAGGYAAPEATYEQREAIELAFIAALQLLPARQRAVLVMRDVLAFSAQEVAEAISSTVPAVNSALQRARTTMSARLPDRSQQATLRDLGDAAVRALVGRFVDAFEAGDVPGILALLAEDVAFAMPPYPAWCRTRADVSRSWLMPGGPGPRLRYSATSANGQPAVGTYLQQPGTGWYVPLALDVLTLREGGGGAIVAAVTAFRSPELFRRFDLPDTLG